MNFFRCKVSMAGILASACLCASVHATEVHMAGGSVSFSTPDTWVGIMQTQGDPEMQVFQVPDPSPTGKTNLARVAVTVKQIGDASGFQQFISDANAKAMALPGYQASANGKKFAQYSAQESGAVFSYVEYYWMKSGHAIQLLCARPATSEAGPAWTAAFDKGCQTVAARLK